MKKLSGTEVKIIGLERFFKDCLDETTKFVSRVDDGTNKCSSEKLIPSRSLKKNKTVQCIDDQAQEKNDDSYTQSIGSDSNGNSSEDEDDDDDDDGAYQQYTRENANALECFIHPHNKQNKNSKEDSKIRFEGLTLYDQEKHACARAALFLYWPRGIFHYISFFLNISLYLMFSLFSASVVEIVYKDIQLALSEHPINITMKDLEVVQAEWEQLSVRDKLNAYHTFTKFIEEGKYAFLVFYFIVILSNLRMMHMMQLETTCR
jgi:hypothetical protein